MNETGTNLLSSIIRELTGYLEQPWAYVIVLGVLSSLFLILIIASRNQIQSLSRKLVEADEQFRQLEQENEILRKSETDLKIREAKLVTLIRSERRNSTEKLALLEEGRNQLKLQFADLAREIFDEKSTTFSNQSRERLESILKPFHLHLDELKSEIRQTYLNDTRERTSLKSELHHLKEMNQQISREAVNLTRALKGDKKLQGSWGELVLEKILEQSGLRNGHEYETQRGYRDQNNKLFKPDVVLHLPDKRDIIVDSKVSLVAWEKYCSCEEAHKQQEALVELVTAIRTHITTLSNKNYEDLIGTHSLDFVLMFMPIDAAFLAAFDFDQSLFNDAFSKKVVVVTPTTLLATLRTIENIWRYEKQSMNSLEIARRAGSLYDKFRGFVEDLEKIGKQLEGCSSTYESAMNKLSTGRANLIAQASQLTELGVQVKKELPKDLIDQQDAERLN